MYIGGLRASHLLILGTGPVNRLMKQLPGFKRTGRSKSSFTVYRHFFCSMNLIKQVLRIMIWKPIVGAMFNVSATMCRQAPALAVEFASKFEGSALLSDRTLKVSSSYSGKLVCS